MSKGNASQIQYSECVALGDFVGQINDLRDEDTRKRLTEAGADFGIEAEKRLSEKGNEYDVFFYTEKAQREIVEWLLE